MLECDLLSEFIFRGIRFGYCHGFSIPALSKDRKMFEILYLNSYRRESRVLSPVFVVESTLAHCILGIFSSFFVVC